MTIIKSEVLGKKLIEKIYKTTSILCNDPSTTLEPDSEYQYSPERIKKIYKAFNKTDIKAKTAEIINSTEIDAESQESDQNCFPYTCADFDLEQLFDSYSYLQFNATETPSLNTFDANDIINIEYEDGLPTKIQFNKLNYPILSLAFCSVIREVRFGNDNHHIYKKSTYSSTQQYLLTNGFDIPENVYQTHYFFVYLCKYLPSEYVRLCFPDSTTGNMSGALNVIDMLQVFNGYSSANFYDPKHKLAIHSIDELEKETLTKMMDDYWIPWGPGPCSGCITIKDYHQDGENAGILYNTLSKKYLGAYESTLDGNSFFRSAPDYINNQLSQPNSLLILTAYKTYIIDNNVSIDDGINYEIIKHVWGVNVDYNLYVTQKGYIWNKILEMDEDRETLANKIGVPIDTIDEEHAGLTQGWINAIPW